MALILLYSFCLGALGFLEDRLHLRGWLASRWCQLFCECSKLEELATRQTCLDCLLVLITIFTDAKESTPLITLCSCTWFCSNTLFLDHHRSQHYISNISFALESGAPILPFLFSLLSQRYLLLPLHTGTFLQQISHLELVPSEDESTISNSSKR